MYKIICCFMIFLVYSIIGYLCEITAVSLEQKKVVLSRGYLIGPIIPVFGFGGLLISCCLYEYQDNPLTLFILGTVYCCILEYITSFLMEKIYGLRWWDYSDKRFNINGRICLENGVLFGLGSIFVINITNPIIFHFLKLIPNNVVIILGIILFIILLIDFIISTNAIVKLKIDIKKYSHKDATEEIRHQVFASIKRNALLYKRLFRAFPYIRKDNVVVRQLIKVSNKLKDLGRKTLNKKGFTLVELLAVLVILGIISAMSFPLIRGLQERNTYTKYEKYGESLVSAAKLYINSYEEDVFRYEEDLNDEEKAAGQCEYISYLNLKEKNLIRDYGVSGVSCNSPYTFVKVTRKQGKYTYDAYLGCGDEKNLNDDKMLEGKDIYFALPELPTGQYYISENCSVSDAPPTSATYVEPIPSPSPTTP